MLIIPVRSDLPSYSFTVAIAKALYRLGVHWNSRGEFWTLDLSTRDGSPIVLGTRLVPNWDLLGRYTDPRLPPGRFVALDRSGLGSAPGRNDLGDRVVLLFAGHEEIDAAL